MRKFLDSTIHYTLYPLLLAMGWGTGFLLTSLTWGGFLLGTAGYVAFVLLLRTLEQLRPFEPAWLRKDGQLPNDLALWGSGYLEMPIIAWVSVTMGNYVKSSPTLSLFNIWPTDLPVFIAVPLAFILCDIGVYVAHRLGHEMPLFWRLHGVHHSAPRLTVLNSSRHHFVEGVVVATIFMTVPILLGIPPLYVVWFRIFRKWSGVLAHANINMSSRLFSYFLSTPELHRWHHSRDWRVGNSNYGATMFWDHLCGTWYRPDARPPRSIGSDAPMSASLIDQLVHPFTIRGHHAGKQAIATLEPGEAGSEHFGGRFFTHPAPLKGDKAKPRSPNAADVMANVADADARITSSP